MPVIIPKYTPPVFLGIWLHLAAGETRNFSSFIYVIIFGDFLLLPKL